MVATNQQPVVSIIGGTGKTGKWAVKGALVRGYAVRLLARTPAKVEHLLQELMPGSDVKELLAKVTIVKGSVGAADGSDRPALLELMTGADVVLSFLGMTKPPEWAVCPGVQSIVNVMKSMDRPPRFLSMSSIGLSESKAQANKAWGRVVVSLALKVALKNCFKDMQAAEDYITVQRQQNPTLKITIVRASILGDKKGYICDYAGEKAYQLVKTDEKAKLSFTVDRQQVSQGFLDLCVDSTYDNQNVSIFENK